MKTKFEEFNDGIVDIYSINGDDRLEVVIKGLRFGEENVSITRHFAARAADTSVDRVIHVLQRHVIKPYNVALIGDVQYGVDKVDHVGITRPPITKLSLRLLEKHKEKEFA